MCYVSGKNKISHNLSLYVLNFPDRNSIFIAICNYNFREDSKVSHYIINKMSQGDQARYRIGDQMFNDLPALLNFYKVFEIFYI